MFIQEQPKCIFIAVPKTASIAIHRMLETSFARKIPHGPSQKYHQSASKCLQELGEENWREYFSFGFVRNPYSRFYSLYRDFSSSVRRERGEGTASGSFESFCEGFLESNFCENIHFQPQHHFLCHQGSIAVDRVGHFETLEQDLKSISQQLKTPFAPLTSVTVISAWTHYAESVPILKRCKAKIRELARTKTGDEWKQAYSNKPALVELVCKHYAKDFEMFNYSIEINNN